MLEREVRIINPLGLHARAAAKLVRCSVRYKSSVTLALGSDTANAKSILSVLALAAGFGTLLKISIDGPDEAELMKEVAVLFISGFGEV